MPYSVTDGARGTLAHLLAPADIRLDGDRPWDLRINDLRACTRILREHNLGLGEAYMDGWVDCAAWDQFADRVLRARLLDQVEQPWRLAAYALEGWLFNLGSRTRAFKIGEHHYDIGNDLYAAMLDRRMTYTCGWWKGASDLDQAQEAKLDLTCRKLGLAPGMKVLDIGCGWGSFAEFAAREYGVSVVGITVSREQIDLGRKRCEGLPVELRLQDYRDVPERGIFDRVVSLGMFEHVVHKNYRTYMSVARRVMREDGLFLLHTIGGNRSAGSTDPWIHKYIFPNSMLPSVAQIGRSVEDLFVMEDWHNFGADYDKTLMAWHGNVERHWPELSKTYDERFHRMWRYYLLTCAGSFRARENQLWQIVLSPRGVPGGYASIR